jgi:hypothetical protein
VLKSVADSRGVPAKAAFEEGTPQPAIDFAKKKLGPENVLTCLPSRKTRPMAERIACLYARLPSAQHLDELAASLRLLGVTLADPETRVVVAVDEEGEPAPVSEEDFRSGLASSPEARFLWRFGPDDRRYCRVRQEGDASIVEFGLEGYEEREVRALRDALEAHFVAHPGSALGFVFDPQGATEEVDWDGFFLRRGEVASEDCPDGSTEPPGLGASDAERLRIVFLRRVFLNVRAQRLGELVVLRR